LYEYARAGQTVEREPRRVTIHSLTAEHHDGDELVIEVRCSKGTYVRTLAESIGEALGCGAHLIALRRTVSGPVAVADAIGLAELEALDEAQRLALLQPTDSLLADWPAHELGAEDAGRFITGLRRRVDAPDAPALRVYGPPLDGQTAPLFLGSAHTCGGELIPTRLLSPTELQPTAPDAVVARRA
jgi:tRNA pseudouridine55 synthase